MVCVTLRYKLTTKYTGQAFSRARSKTAVFVIRQNLTLNKTRLNVNLIMRRAKLNNEEHDKLDFFKKVKHLKF